MQASTSASTATAIRSLAAAARCPLARCSYPCSASRAASTSTAAAAAAGSGIKVSSKRSRKLQKPPSVNALPLSEAIRTLQSLSPGDTGSAYELTLLAKLAQSVNVNSLRGRTFLQYDAANSKKKDTILVFAEGAQAEEAKKEGADIVGGSELIDELLQAKVSPTKIICAPDQLPAIVRSQLPRILGPKGLMPSAKRGTVTSDIAQAIRDAKGGLDWLGVETRSAGKSSSSGSGSKKDSANHGYVSVPIARLAFTNQQIEANIAQFTKELLDVCNGVGTQAEVSTTGGKKNKRAQIEKAYLTTSRGLSVEITDVDRLVAV